MDELLSKEQILENFQKVFLNIKNEVKFQKPISIQNIEVLYFLENGMKKIVNLIATRKATEHNIDIMAQINEIIAICDMVILFSNNYNLSGSLFVDVLEKKIFELDKKVTDLFNKSYKLD